MPFMTVETASSSVGEGCPAILWAKRMAETRRAMLEAFRPERACSARKAATVSGEAGRAVRAWLSHQALKAAMSFR